MMLRKLPVLLLPLVLSYPAISVGDDSRPSNYDECILDAMRGVSSDIAARAIIDSCRNLFPASPPAGAPQAAPRPAPAPAPATSAAAPAPVLAPKPAASVAPEPLDTSNARALTADELAQLNARARVFGDSYRVIVENDHPALTLTEVTIAVWDETDAASPRKEYSEAVQIAPQAAATVKYTVRYRGDETGWRWAVVAARGVE
jgi:pyruvate/2-oxoglutarate dehydrogenase complex dihydrolipoamide acyltransferase (E2) component